MTIYMEFWLTISIFTRRNLRTPSLPLSLHCKDRKFSPNFDSFPKSLDRHISFCSDCHKFYPKVETLQGKKYAHVVETLDRNFSRNVTVTPGTAATAATRHNTPCCAQTFS